MANSFSDLRKNRNASLSKLREKLEQQNSKTYKQDDRYWQPTVDKAGNGYAVIRLLSAPMGEEYPWVMLWSHGFKGPTGQWYIENSLTTLGLPDPVNTIAA